MMYKYVEKLLVDGKKSRLMGTSRIDKQRDVRLRIVLWKTEELCQSSIVHCLWSI